MRTVWFIGIGLAVGALGLRMLASRGWRGGLHADLGSMSEEWLAEQRAAVRR